MTSEDAAPRRFKPLPIAIGLGAALLFALVDSPLHHQAEMGGAGPEGGGEYGPEGGGEPDDFSDFFRAKRAAAARRKAPRVDETLHFL